MTALNAELAITLADHLQSQLAVVAENFNQCFDLAMQLAVEPPAPWAAESAISDSGPGVACVLQVGDAAAAVLIPEALLPGWYRSPNDSEQARLDTLAMEWGINLFPSDLETERSASFSVDDLRSYVKSCQPARDTLVIGLPVRNAEQVEVAKLQLVWPLAAPDWEPAPLPLEQPSAPASAAVPPTQSPPVSALPHAPKSGQPDPLARLRKLPVTVSVQLTQRRISMSQLLAITPGALLTFTKSCDDLLDLYVNNALYCRGEAVKIGESFGLKINEVGVHTVREPKVFD